MTPSSNRSLLTPDAMLTKRWTAGTLRQIWQNQSPSFLIVYTMSQMRQRRRSMYTRRRLIYIIHVLDPVTTHTIMDRTFSTPMESPTLTLLVHRIDSLASCTEKSRIHVISIAVPTWGTPTVHHVFRRKSRLSQRRLHQNTSQRQWSRLTLDSMTSWIPMHIMWSIATNFMTTL